MRIGDKVRFLNAVGGGIITAFQGKDLVLVCDEDGFEVPTLRSELVVITTDNYNLPRPQQKTAALTTTASSVKAALAVEDETNAEQETDLADAPLRFRPRPIERKGGDSLQLYLAFEPQDHRQLSSTTFEMYLVNDSNLYVRFLLLEKMGEQVRLRHEGSIDPNQKVLLEALTHNDLPELEHLTLQTMAYKEGKPYALTPPQHLDVRVDATKFYKLHTFQPTDFFTHPALLFPLVKDGTPVKGVSVTATQLQEAMGHRQQESTAFAPAHSQRQRKTTSQMADRNAVIEVDLHAHQLLDDWRGMERKDILMCQIKCFHDTMRAHSKERGRRIVFIHGKGEGVLRNELLKELKRYYPQCLHQDASFREYGFGATMVTIR